MRKRRNPATAVAWLAGQGREFRRAAAQRRHRVTPGQARSRRVARAGDEFVADFTGLGLVRLSSNKGANMPSKAKCGRLSGRGNISTDLLYKLPRSEWLEPRWMVGIDPRAMARRARPLGLRPPTGVDWCWRSPIKLRLGVRGNQAYVHRDAAPSTEAGTDAGGGGSGIPPGEPARAPDAPNVNMITCGDRRPFHRVRGALGSWRCPTPRSWRRWLPFQRTGHARQHRRVHYTTTVVRPSRRPKGDHHLESRRPADDHARHHLCAIPTDADREADRRLHPRRRQRGGTHAWIPAAQRNRSSTSRRSTRGGQALVTTFVEVEGAGDYLSPLQWAT